MCPICLGICDNPKSLPCLHAFCLRCLQGLYRGRLPGDRASCPKCRKDFRIPRDGVGGLQHHFIVQQLVDQERERIRLRGGFCDEHKDEEVKLYCHDCKENICLVCSADKHRNHNSGDISEVAGEFRLTIDQDDKQILSAINSVHEQMGLMKQDVTGFLGEVEDARKKLLATADVVKRSVDDQIHDVLMELQSVTSESAVQAESLQDTYQLAIMSMESFHARVQELLDKGRPCDITRAACELRDKTKELLDSTAVNYRPHHVTFTPADVTQVKRLSLIGKLTTRTEEGLSHVCFVHFTFFRLMLVSVLFNV